MAGREMLKRLRMPAQIVQSIFPMEVAITGDLDSDDPIRIDGLMEGNVRGTVVTVSRKAFVKGAIRADAVRIEGSVEGRVEAASIVVTRHARVSGEVECGTLDVETGARIEASCLAGRPEGLTARDQEQMPEDKAPADAG